MTVSAIPRERAPTSIKMEEKRKGHIDNMSEKEGTQYEAGAF